MVNRQVDGLSRAGAFIGEMHAKEKNKKGRDLSWNKCLRARDIDWCKLYFSCRKCSFR